VVLNQKAAPDKLRKVCQQSCAAEAKLSSEAPGAASTHDSRTLSVPRSSASGDSPQDADDLRPSSRYSSSPFMTAASKAMWMFDRRADRIIELEVVFIL
jgi:hypothetical protein